MGNETKVMISLVGPSFPDDGDVGNVVMNITEHAIPVGVGQFDWEPVSCFGSTFCLFLTHFHHGKL